MAITLPTFSIPLVRQARPSLFVGGKDILAGLASQYILGFSYTDNTSDQADDLSIEIADKNRYWMQHYMPKKGMEVQASITVSNWNAPGDTRTLKCGTFFIDNVGIRGFPNVVSMKGTSIPTDTGLKNEKRTKSWENSDLQSIAGQIASSNNLTLFYDTKNNPTVKRTDQVEKADIQYLRDRAKENSLSIKIHDKKLVVYSEQEYEAKAAAYIIRYGKSNILSYEFNSKCDDTYDSAENSYVNPETGKLTKTEFSPDKPPEGVNSTLKLNERVDYDKDGNADYSLQLLKNGKEKAGGFTDYDFTNDAPAQNAGKGEKTQERSEQKCKAKLREKNKKERQAAISVAGNINYLSGVNFQLVDFGIFDDKWFAETTIHSISEDGYTTQLKLRTALEGY
jgi:Bacteriophage probable baseplate hub protein